MKRTRRRSTKMKQRRRYRLIGWTLNEQLFRDINMYMYVYSGGCHLAVPYDTQRELIFNAFILHPSLLLSFTRQFCSSTSTAGPVANKKRREKQENLTIKIPVLLLTVVKHVQCHVFMSLDLRYPLRLFCRVSSKIVRISIDLSKTNLSRYDRDTVSTSWN